MNYDITIRPNRKGKTGASRGTVEFTLNQFPALRRESPGLFIHEAPNRRSQMNLRLDDKDPVESIRVNIPAVLLRADGGRALQLCFEISEQLGWGILDEQLGGYIERDAIPDVLDRHQFAGETVTEFLDRRTAGRAGFRDIFRYHLRPQTRKGLLISMGLSALIAGIVVVQADVTMNAFPLLAVAIFVVIVSAKAAVQTLREKKRRDGSVRNHPVS